MYGKQRKVIISPLEKFDPRPSKYRVSTPSHLTNFLGKVREKGLGVSLLFDSSSQHWTVDEPSSDNQPPNLPLNLPSHHDLCKAIEEFKKCLHVSEESRKIERETTKCFSTLWYTVHKYRLTASHFGEVFCRKSDTPPYALVLSLLKPWQLTSPAVDWRIQQEPKAIEEY